MELVKLGKVKDILGVSYATLHNWNKKGKLHFIVKNNQNHITKECYLDILRKKYDKNVLIYIFKSALNNVDINEQISKAQIYCSIHNLKIEQIYISVLEIVNLKKIEKYIIKEQISKIIMCGTNKEHYEFINNIAEKEQIELKTL